MNSKNAFLLFFFTLVSFNKLFSSDLLRLTSSVGRSPGGALSFLESNEYLLYAGAIPPLVAGGLGCLLTAGRANDPCTSFWKLNAAIACSWMTSNAASQTFRTRDKVVPEGLTYFRKSHELILTESLRGFGRACMISSFGKLLYPKDFEGFLDSLLSLGVNYIFLQGTARKVESDILYLGLHKPPICLLAQDLSSAFYLASLVSSLKRMYS